MNSIRTYSELCRFGTFEDRFEYLNLSGKPFEETFGFDRILNQHFYTSDKWRSLRNEIILRDNGCDLGVEGYDIHGKIYIHHMNPIDKKDILFETDYLSDPEYLICASYRTHQAIHYGNIDMAKPSFAKRSPNDTCPWRK